nr:uncharacterized protein FLJ43738-like [Microcebus murinus]
MMEIKELIERESFSSLTNLLEKQKSQIKAKDAEKKKKVPKKIKKVLTIEEDLPPLPPIQWKPSIFSTQLSLMPLLAGEQAVVSRSSEKSANILECMLTLKTEVPIMTEEQKQDLNPLTIKIKCASCLPSQPVPIQELKRLCVPVYCKYQFHATPVHRTEGQPHASHVHFQDINVIFLGAVSPRDLREYLEGPPLLVEVHDRDRRSEECSRKPALFGDDPLDPYLNSQRLASTRETEANPFQSQDAMWDPYGVARVSLADLLLGHRYLNLAVPIHTCEAGPPPGTGGGGEAGRGRRLPPDGAHHGPMPPGHYIEAHATLKLRVDLAVPLRPGAPPASLTASASAAAGPPCPASAASTSGLPASATRFGRIVFAFGFRRLAVLHGILQDVTAINARALDLEAYPARSVQQILSAFKTRVKIHDRPQLDVLTGFHLLDGRLHLFVLEGLAEQGLRRLLSGHRSETPTSTSERSKCKVLYDSQLLFHQRLYADLETILYHVHLFQPLAQLMRHTALYLRKALPRRAFQALARVPGRRYTYSQRFLSATLEPLDVQEEDRKARERSRRAWLTPAGFQVTGLRDGIEENRPGLQLPVITDVVEEWKEKELFANKLKPVLDRDRWGWDRRHLDFDLYTRPPPTSFPVPPSPAPKPGVTVSSRK